MTQSLERPITATVPKGYFIVLVRIQISHYVRFVMGGIRTLGNQVRQFLFYIEIVGSAFKYPTWDDNFFSSQREWNTFPRVF